MNNKYKSLGLNAFLNAFKSGLSIIFPLITYPYAYRILQAEGIGKVDYANSIVGYFSIIAALGINTYAIREGAKLRGDKEKFSTFCNQVFSFNCVSALISYCALFVLLAISDSLRSYNGLIWILSLTIVFTTLGVDWLNTIFEDYLYITVRSIVTHLASLVLLFVFVRDANDYYWYAALTVLTNGIVCISNWFYCRKYCKVRFTTKIKFKDHAKPIFTLFANNVAIKIYMSSDTTMLGALLGDYYVGIYSIAVKIYNVVKQMLAAMYTVAISRLSYFAGNGDYENFKKVYTSILSNITLILLPASIGLASVSNEVILFMGGQEYLEAVPTLQILCISLVGAIFGGAVTYCLNIPLGRERVNMIATTLSAIINVALNVFMIPLFKQNGAALTTAISEFFVFFYCLITFKNKKEFIDFKLWGKNLIHACIGGVVIIFISIVTHILLNSTLAILAITISLSVLTYGLILILLKNELAIDTILKIKNKIKKA